MLSTKRPACDCKTGCGRKYKKELNRDEYIHLGDEQFSRFIVVRDELQLIFENHEFCENDCMLIGEYFQQLLIDYCQFELPHFFLFGTQFFCYRMVMRKDLSVSIDEKMLHYPSQLGASTMEDFVFQLLALSNVRVKIQDFRVLFDIMVTSLLSTVLVPPPDTVASLSVEEKQSTVIVPCVVTEEKTEYEFIALNCVKQEIVVKVDVYSCYHHKVVIRFPFDLPTRAEQEMGGDNVVIRRSRYIMNILGTFMSFSYNFRDYVDHGKATPQMDVYLPTIRITSGNRIVGPLGLTVLLYRQPKCKFKNGYWKEKDLMSGQFIVVSSSRQQAIQVSAYMNDLFVLSVYWQKGSKISKRKDWISFYCPIELYDEEKFVRCGLWDGRIQSNNWGE